MNARRKATVGVGIAPPAWPHALFLRSAGNVHRLRPVVLKRLVGGTLTEGLRSVELGH
jgi:hypothetical protein